MKAMTWALAATAAVLGGLYYARQTPGRLAGDAAKPGDVVHVPVGALQAGGGLPGAFPPGVGLVAIKVSGTAPDTLDGLITDYVVSETPLQTTTLPVPVGPLRIQRADVTRVFRNDMLVTV